MKQHRPYYGQEVIRREQQERIRKILEPYQEQPVTDALKAEVWERLQAAKASGEITIPFKMQAVPHPDVEGGFQIEILLDTRV